MKRHIYFIPGTAATSKIFKGLSFPKESFELHYLEWILPTSKHESLDSYTNRFMEQISHENPIIIGVSFGGVLAQEIGKKINCEKIILISSIKDIRELPKKLKLIKKLHLYKLIPLIPINFIEKITLHFSGKRLNKTITSYKAYLSYRDPKYLYWAVKSLLFWSSENHLNNILHIHGEKDVVFPIKHISNCVRIKKGSHVMILLKAKKINKILSKELA